MMRPVRTIMLAPVLLACASILAPSAKAQPLLGEWQAPVARPTTTAPTTAPAAAKPKAILVRNPSPTPGDPPYALTDPAGRIQRLVEPTPGVNLDAHVGGVVRVAHDTGGTLLASQLELPGELAMPRTVAVAAPRVVAVQHTSENLPPPVVYEDVVGESVQTPSPDTLQFPSAIQSNGPTMAYPSASSPCVGCGSIVGGSCPQCAVPGVWSCSNWLCGADASIDFLYLRTHGSSGVTSSSEFESGTRLEFGKTSMWGRRWAIRYFEYDAGLSGMASGNLDVETLDLEFQRRFKYGPRCEVAVGGGVRWAEYNESSGQTYEDSVGPMLMASARAPAFGSVDATLLVRQSFQFGDVATAGTTSTGRGTFGISEFQFGLEHRRPTRAGEGFIRGFFEAQYWDDVSLAAGLPGSRGLVGFGLGAGLRR